MANCWEPWYQTTRIFERIQVVHADDKNRVTEADGEAGYGVYAYPSGKRSFRKYYSSRRSNAAQLGVFRLDAKPEAIIVDLTVSHQMASLLSFARERFNQLAGRMPGYQKPTVSARSIQRFGSVIEDFVRKFHPDVSAYLVPHYGPGIPSGEQLVVLKLDQFEVSLVKVLP